MASKPVLAIRSAGDSLNQVPGYTPTQTAEGPIVRYPGSDPEEITEYFRLPIPRQRTRQRPRAPGQRLEKDLPIPHLMSL
jgi:hypothetical protein